MIRLFLLLKILLAIPILCLAQAERIASPMPFQSPAVSRTQIAFVYAGSVWTVDRNGGEARRLTSEAGGDESFPLFSPDGSQIAFSKNVGGGNTDVFIKSVSGGGETRRLTFHPDVDLVVGWTPDSKNVLFRSLRTSNDLSPRFVGRFFTIPVEGGYEMELPFPMGANGSFSPAGDSLAYTSYRSMSEIWRNYRGGGTSAVKIAKLYNLAVEEIPRKNSNDSFPMWLGNKIYFTSDRTQTVNLFAFDPSTKKIDQLTQFEKYDIRFASGSAETVVFVRDGTIYLYDVKASKLLGPVDIRVSGDFPEIKSRKINVENWVTNFELSPDGENVLFEGRGDVLTMNVKTKEVGNLTNSSDSAERFPVWSPDGKSIAYFSDESGEYQLNIKQINAEGGSMRKISIEKHPSFYTGLVWSPDSKKLAFSDKRLALWIAEINSGTVQKVDTSDFSRQLSFQPSWSRDGKWLAYSKVMPNRIATVFLYSFDAKKSYSVTDGRTDAESPVFDKNGQYLYFTASNNAGPAKLENAGMSSGLLFPPLVTRKVYAVALQKETHSPLIAFSDRESVLRQEKRLDIDVENIGQRLVPLPIPVHNTIDLAAGKPGVVFALGKWIDTVHADKPAVRTLYKLDLAALKPEKFIEDASEYRMSADGSKLLVLKGDDLSVVSAESASAKEGEGKLDLSGLMVNIDPRAEWKQIYNEVWRLERDYLFYPDLHGQNLAALKEHYARFLPNVVTRGDLNVLMREMLSHLSISHMENGGGDIPASSGGNLRENTGVLGADFKSENGRYKITRLYQGDNSIPALRGALTQSGTDVREGDYLLAIDDKEVSATENLYKYLIGKAGKLVQLKVSSDPTGKQSRSIEIVPMSSDKRLRDYARVENNRRLVNETSQGKLGYIYLPNVNVEGFDIFVRDFYSQLDKKGLIIDQRFNSGGYASDFIIEALKRAPLAGYKFRDGKDIVFPADVIQGPKVMLITEFAGSGGDSLAWFFKEAKLGSLVGTTTRGYGIGHYINLPELMDGGYVRAPHRAFYDLKSGKLETENAGVTPDYPVEWTPVNWNSGRDPQLEKAIEVALKQIPAQDKKLKVLNK